MISLSGGNVAEPAWFNLSGQRVGAASPSLPANRTARRFASSLGAQDASLAGNAETWSAMNR